MDKNYLKIEFLDKLSSYRKNNILKRSGAELKKITPLITRIFKDIKKNGDSALFKYTKKFDMVTLKKSNLFVSKDEIKQAYRTIKKDNPGLIPKIKDSIECIKTYHTKEKKYFGFDIPKWEEPVQAKSWGKGKQYKIGQFNVPLERIGVYIPGGNAVLFTTAMMGITPAKVAGVDEIIAISPPTRNGNIDPKIIVTADLAGADYIIRIGGAQGIAALACGTQSVPKVDKVFGPGNIYVTAAKSYAASNGLCGIDFIAGPSEILVIADNTINPEYAAADMISQAEHDINASSVLITDSKSMAVKIRKEVIKLLKNPYEKNKLSGVAIKSLKKYGTILVAKSIDDAIEFSNEFAPEHLEIMTKNPDKWLKKIRNAGTVCLGQYTPVAISDYICPNHILPTAGAARYTSGISVRMFYKKISFLKSNKRMVSTLNNAVEILSKCEGLYNQHGLTLAIRNK